MNHSIGHHGRAAIDEVSGWIPPVARLGYAAKGVVYALVGWIAMKAAMAAGKPGGPAEALASLADERGGRIVLAVVAIGLLGHVVWRLVQATLDPEHRGSDAKRVGMRLFYALSALVYGSLAFTAWQLGQGDRSGEAGNGHEIWVARLLEQPYGAWLVMAAGLGVIAYGVHQLIKAARGNVNRHMSVGPGTDPRWLSLLGRIGTAARGVVLLPIGWFVFGAGRTYRAEEAADTGEVLGMLGSGGLLAAVGAGLLAYGLHQIAKAVYRRIQPPV